MQKIHLGTITSTNDYAKEIINSISKNTLITTDHQTHGRGRFSRPWYSSKKENFTGTFVFKPPLSLPKALMVATLSVIDVLEAYDLHGQIKLPNDIYIKQRKIAGILIEKDYPNTYCLLGIGININSYAKALATQATSLSEQVGRVIDLEDFTTKLTHIVTNHQQITTQHLFVRFRKHILKSQQYYETGNDIALLQDIDINLNCKVNNAWTPCQKLSFVKSEKRKYYK